MTDNPDYGTIIFDLLRMADDGDAAPLTAYLAADPMRAASADRRYVVAVRNQYGTIREGCWYSYSAQPDRNPWPGTPTRTALVLLRSETSRQKSWHELTLPAGTCIEDIRSEGRIFRIRVNNVSVTTSGDDIFRVIADCSFGPPGVSEGEIQRGFGKLAGHTPLEVVGSVEPDAPLGTALPLILQDPVLGWFAFRTERPARYIQTHEDGPSYSLFADLSGSFDAALALARNILPDIEAQVARAARLVKAIKINFGEVEGPRLLSAAFHDDEIVRISIDDGLESSGSACLELGTNGELNLIAIDDN